MSIITTNFELILSRLREGDIVAIPTETVYGLAGNAEDETAIRKIYALKKRPIDHPLIMHVAEGWDLSQWIIDIPDYACTLMENFWPGPLTLVMNCDSKQVNPLITGGQSTLALRCPQHPITQQLLQQLGFPLVAPSANPFGKISPTTAEHVQQSFLHEDLLILDGGRCQVGIESTIVAATDSQGYTILRHGVITEAEINAVLPDMRINSGSSIKVPGKLKQHYQPEKPLYYFNDVASLNKFCEQTGQTIYKISFAKLPEENSEFHYQLLDSPEQAAFELYYQLRRADQSAASFIVIELPPDSEPWQAIRERIIKAGKSG